jgi:hypothetical protein
VIIRMPAITTASRIPVPVARNASAIFIAIFLLNLIEKTKTRRTISPDVDSGLSPRPVAVVDEV